MAAAAPSRFTFNRELLIRIFFFSAFAFLLYQTFLLARPFLPPLLVSAMLVITFFPIYRRVRNRVKNVNVASLIMTFCVMLAFVLPASFLVGTVINEAGNLIPAVQSAMEAITSGDAVVAKEKLPPVLYSQGMRAIDYLNSLNIDARPFILDHAQELGARITGIGALIAKNALFTIIRLLILLIGLFFMFRDGEPFLKWVLNLVPMEAGHKQDIARSAYETFRAVTIGVFLTAAVQGLLAMTGFFIAGIRLPVLLGFITGMVSLLGASFIVTIPAALFVMMENSGRGIFLLIWGAVVVGWIDNILKPVLIGSRARMPFVLVFFSILGGLKAYGLLGIIIGPILVASVMTFIRIYREAYGA